MRKLISILALLAALFPAASAAQADAHTFIIATDMHYISPALTDHGEYFTNLIASGDGKMVMYIDELTDAFIDEVIVAKPDGLILSGDLTFNGARKSHADFANKLRRVSQAGIPVFVLPGNHDLYRYSAAKFEGNGYTRVASITSEEFAAIYHDLGFDAALSRDSYSLSYVAEPVSGVRLLMLDVNTENMECAIAQNTFVWLEQQLEQAKADGAKVIAVSHQNLYAHSSLLSKGYVISNASMLKSLYHRYGVAVNLSGHLHIQHTISGKNIVPEIATSSLAVSPCQYGVINMANGQAQYRTRVVDVNGWAQKSGETDTNLLRFRETAAGFFAVTAINQAAAQLAGDRDPSAMATWLSRLNAAYFSGRMDTVDPSSPYALRWQESNTFFGQYVQSILSEEPKDHTHFSFPL